MRGDTESSTAISKKHHPHAGGVAERMAALNEACAVLGDPEPRAAYDASRPPRTIPAAATAVWSDTSEARAVYAAPPGTVRRSGTSSTLEFGRYAGWTLEALAREDPDYHEWLARAPGGRQYRTEIYALLSRRNTTVPRATRTAPPPGGGWRMPWRARSAG